MASSDLCTLADVKELLDETTTDYDADLNLLIDAASEYIEQFCDRAFYTTTYTSEKYDGNGEDDFWPHNYPVTAISSLAISGSTVTESADYSGSGYFLYDRPQNAPSRIHYDGGFSEGHQNVVISYTAGYATIPSDLAQACRDLVIWKFKQRKEPGIKSEHIGNYSYTRGDLEAAGVMTVLQIYKRKWVL